jgi:hypothetical protein
MSTTYCLKNLRAMAWAENFRYLANYWFAHSDYIEKRVYSI